MTSTEVESLLEAHALLKFDKGKGKVICNHTKHEMPPTVEAIESYIKGKKYKKASEQQTFDYKKYQQHLVPSTKRRHLHELFCKLTLRHIGKSPKDVERHVSGKRYKKALARYEKCKASGEKFVPRVGGRKKKTATSDSDNNSVDGGDWEDDDSSGDEGDDDMSDLYPDEDSGSDASDNSSQEDDDDAKDSVPENTDPENETPQKNSRKKKKTAQVKGPMKTEEASYDSDYDLGVLDNDRNNCNDHSAITNTVKSSPASSKASSDVSDNKGSGKKSRKRKLKHLQTDVSSNVEGGSSKKKKKKAGK